MTDFEGIVSPLGQALTKRGYETLTPVQVAVSAPELIDSDALVSAQTGSGKTVAFGIAIAPTLLQGSEKFTRAGQPLALIVAPTRELALQVKRELDWLYEMTGATIASCVGGMDMRTERRALDRGAHIVVGTPGRLRDHIERGSLELGQIRSVVLDEADEMLDLGFRDDLEYILGASPAERRTLMFSATVPRSIATLATRYQRDAVRVATTTEREQHVDIDYQGLVVAPNDRENAIINILRFFDAKNTLVFCGTRATVNHMTSRLNNRGFSVVALSGELSQNERTHALQAMRDGRARVCVATDVAARGIDLPNLDLVIHADLPRNGEALLHRSGRTGRAGRKGTSILIVPHNARRRTERLLGNASIDASWGKPPSLDDIVKRDRERILDDVLLTEPLKEEEQIFARELLARHNAEQIAAAFFRLHRDGQPAPEELLDTAPLDAPKPRREDFKNGVWFSLSVGRKDQAEARWLLPMLCRAGHITKNEIGAIRIHQTETHFELAPAGVDKFLEALGPSRKVEKNIEIKRLEGIPSAPNEGPKKFDRNKRGKDRSEERARPHTKAKRTFSNKPDSREKENKPERATPPFVKREKSYKKDEARKPYPKAGGFGASSERSTDKTKAKNPDSREKGNKQERGNSTFVKREKSNKNDEARKLHPKAGGYAAPSERSADKTKSKKTDPKKPWEKATNKNKGKKPKKQKRFTNGPKANHPDPSGASPMKRKKPKRPKD